MANIDMNRHEDSKEIQALVWNLADGRLKGEAFERAVQVACDDGEGMRAWHVTHLVGDVLRSQELAGLGMDAEFVQAVQARIATEAFQVSVAQAAPSALDLAALPPRLDKDRADSANGLSWRMIAGVGSMAIGLGAAFLLGGYWPNAELAGALAQSVKTSEPPALAATASALPVAAQGYAAAPPSAASVAAPSVMLRDPRLDELLAAHRQMGGTSALQKPAGFLRNAAHHDQPSR